MTPHKHAEAIRAWADGAQIEMSLLGNIWTPAPAPSWSLKNMYRVVQLEPKTDHILYFNIGEFGASRIKYWAEGEFGAPNVMATFDAETWKLKKLEIME